MMGEKHLRRLAKRLKQRIRPWTGVRETIIVGGVQRSGTNMFMDVLDASLETDVYHETDPRANDGYYLRPLPRLFDLRARSAPRFFVIKALLDLHMMKELLVQLAPAKAVWMYRQYEDMANSNMVSWPGGRNQIDDLVADPMTTGYRGRGMSAETLELVRSLYDPAMNDASAIALFWYYRNKLFFEQGLDHDDRVQLVCYEHVVADPHRTLGRVCKRLGIEFSAPMAAKIHARSVARRRPPEIRPDIRAVCDEMLARLDAASD